MKRGLVTAILPHHALPRVVRAVYTNLTFPHRVAFTNSIAGLINFRQISIGTGCLLLGVLVYITARPEGALFLPGALNLNHYFPVFITGLAGPLPVFFHVLGISLLTAAVLVPSRFATVVICLGWAVVDSLFELGQHTAVLTWINAHLPVDFQDVWLIEQSLHYFQHGTFDPADMIAILLAAAIAYPIICHTTRLRGGGS